MFFWFHLCDLCVFSITFWGFLPCKASLHPGSPPSPPSLLSWQAEYFHIAHVGERQLRGFLRYSGNWISRGSVNPPAGGGDSGRIQPTGSTAGVADAVWINAAGGLRWDTPPPESHESRLDSVTIQQNRRIRLGPSSQTSQGGGVQRDCVPGGVRRRRRDRELLFPRSVAAVMSAAWR